MKTLRCRDVGFDCDQVIRAETEDEILQQAAQHAQNDHNVTVTPEIAAQVRTLINDEAAAPSA
jgi:predicted small metal-binding protein